VCIQNIAPEKEAKIINLKKNLMKAARDLE